MRVYVIRLRERHHLAQRSQRPAQQRRAAAPDGMEQDEVLGVGQRSRQFVKGAVGEVVDAAGVLFLGEVIKRGRGQVDLGRRLDEDGAPLVVIERVEGEAGGP